MGFNIKNNYGPNIEVNAGGKVTLVQDKNGMWHTVDAEEADYEEIVEETQQPVLEDAEEVAAKTETQRDNAELVEKLKPIFYNNETDVKLFLKEIAGMPSNDITDLVNRWVQEKRISDYGYSRKGTLWNILNSAGLYKKSKQNWNRRVY